MQRPYMCSLFKHYLHIPLPIRSPHRDAQCLIAPEDAFIRVTVGISRADGDHREIRSDGEEKSG